MRFLGLLVVTSATLSGCSHTYRLAGFDADPAGLQRSADKRVAIVSAAPRFRSTYSAAADGHTVRFKDMSRFYRFGGRHGHK